MTHGRAEIVKIYATTRKLTGKETIIHYIYKGGRGDVRYI